MTKRALPAAGIVALSTALTFLAGCKIIDGVEPKSADQLDTRGSGWDTGAPPIIWGEPDDNALVGVHYAFQPEAEDADGDALEFSIANKPSWATFDEGSGLLQGVPGERHVGVSPNIVVSVSDGNSIVSLASFDIAVDPVSAGDDGIPDDGGSVSAPPSISGTPNTSVVVGQAYAFRPEASDPDNDSLSYSIVNRPRWLNFKTTTGRLHGTPTEANIGTSHPIEISVTDGTSVAALPRFKITVDAVGTVSKAISWTPPTANEDGTPLTDLAGYRIYYGTAPGDYGEVIELSSPGVTSYVIDGLAPGTYYLAMTSFNSAALESRFTPEVSFTL